MLRSLGFWLLLLLRCSGAEQVLESVQELSQIQTDPGIWLLVVQKSSKDTTATEAIAAATRGIATVAMVPASSPAGQQLGITQSLPVVLLFGAEDKQQVKLLETTQVAPVVQALTQEVTETLQKRLGQQSSGSKSSHERKSSPTKNKVVNLTSRNFDKIVLQASGVVAVAFTAPWCGHCKRLEPEWKEAAAGLWDVTMGWVDATVETDLAAKYQVQGYPTIYIFTPDQRRGIPYQGERTASALIDYLTTASERYPQPVPQLDGPLEGVCGDRICVLAFLPHVLDSGATGRNKYLDTIQAVSKSFRKNFRFVWLEGGTQAQLEDAFGLTFGYPAVVALSMEKKAYSVLRSSFSDKSITSFLHGVTTGRQSVVPLDDVPKAVAPFDVWDGLDAAPIEEEFDLSELFDDGEF